MKDLLLALSREIRGYLPVLAAIASAPKRTILERLYDRSDPLGDALTFFAVTLAISLVLQAPLVGPEHDYLTVIGVILALKLMVLLAFNGAVTIVFHCVGGRGGFIATLGASLYIVGPVYLFIVMSSLLGLGLVTGVDPELAQSLKIGHVTAEGAFHALAETAPGVAIWFALLVISQFVAVTGWFLACWGVYRQIHGVSRIRSAIVYAAAWVIYMLSSRATVVILRGLFAGAPPPLL